MPRVTRPAWTMRRRMVAVVVVLLTVVAAVIGVVSTLALHQNLQSQLDARLTEATRRGLSRPGTGGGDGGTEPGGAGSALVPFPRSSAGAGGRPAATPTVGSTAGPSPQASFTAPPAFTQPGSDFGMVVVVVRHGQTQAAYADSEGQVRQLSTEQAQILLDVPTDGRVRSVSLPELGTYRVAADADAAGTVQVTGLPTASMNAIVNTFVLREVLVAVAGVLAAAFAASWLVGRELRPLVRVAATATRVAELPLAKGEVAISERVDEVDTDLRTEVGQVGAAVNRMLGHVESALAARHESEQQVRQFVADASHELRTPLASIRGYAELVRRSPDELPGEARHALDRVEAETVRMTALVSDMLLLARLDAGRPLAAQSVDLAALAVDAVADAHAAGPDHVWQLDLPGGDEVVPVAAVLPAGTEIDDDVPADEDDDSEPVEVVGDEDRLRQVLVNLLSNARLHTPAGTHVTVSVRREGEYAVMRVHDDGPGIAPDLRARLFQRFTRGDASRNRAAGSTSTGLGMAIAQAVVAAHKGTIAVASSPGDTTFTVLLPAAG